MNVYFVIMAVGGYFLLMNLVRVSVVKAMRARIEQVAESLVEESVAMRVQHDAGISTLVRITREIADASPLLATGGLTFNLPKSEKADPDSTISRTLNHNAWVVPYLMAVLLAITVVEWLGKPWLPFRIVRGILAAIALGFFSDRGGKMRLSKGPDQVSQDMSTIRVPSDLAAAH